jgi:hypothetical protein
MVILIALWGVFGGFMSAKTVDYHECMKTQPQQYCLDHYGVKAGK